MNSVSNSFLTPLRAAFGQALQENAALANYTTARVGGPAAALLPVHTTVELEKAVRALWELDAPFVLIGSGSNLLVSDAGYPGIVLSTAPATSRSTPTTSRPPFGPRAAPTWA